ncbi:uncharacterized protein LOC111627268 [Centruroides sculpturatus]|uniref:uncharacterized protein LOC111627268 n=1 Tax=Centruroides sculpturatus TaxID=218467 RepID=UPI000C6D779F|nr:uncharacterized protein LOC111627268 [Centruroides sculpturatus]
MKKDKRRSNVEEIRTQFKTVDIELKDGVFTFTSPLTIGEFAAKIGKSPNQIINHYFKLGKLYNINHMLTEEQIAELCLEYGYDFSKQEQVTASNFMEVLEIKDDPKDLKPRPPIVVIMGHVDHGKTTLLDKIRNTQVTASEAGGITQHIGAYQVEHEGQKITFIDTPGHEAFTAMRARGAKVTDIVVLVVAADDGVMPQTREAIDHARAAKVAIIVFVNKIDKPGVDLEKVKRELSKENVTAEDWGGDVQFVYGSGLTGQGIEELFKAISLQAEMLELKANPDRFALGTVIESKVDKGRGTIATLIVQNGSLHKGDFVVAGFHYGRIRMMLDPNGEAVKVALPGTPVLITGLNYSPRAGDRFFAFKDEKFAKNLAEQKRQEDRAQELKERIPLQVKEGVKVLNVIIKSDVQGSAQAIKQTLSKIENEEVKVNVVRSSVGQISKSDILLAQASQATIFSFNIRPSNDIKQIAAQEKVTIRPHTVIYQIVEDVQTILKGMMAPKFTEKVTGEAQILKVIYSSKIGNIAGCKVTDGVIKSQSKVRLLREGKIVANTELDSLQRGQDAVRKVEKGFECGAHLANYNDIKVDDVIQAYEQVEVES